MPPRCTGCRRPRRRSTSSMARLSWTTRPCVAGPPPAGTGDLDDVGPAGRQTPRAAPAERCDASALVSAGPARREEVAAPCHGCTGHAVHAGRTATPTVRRSSRTARASSEKLEIDRVVSGEDAVLASREFGRAPRRSDLCIAGFKRSGCDAHRRLGGSRRRLRQLAAYTRSGDATSEWEPGQSSSTTSWRAAASASTWAWV